MKAPLLCVLLAAAASAQSTPFPALPDARASSAVLGPVALPGGIEVHVELERTPDPFRKTVVYVDGRPTDLEAGAGVTLWRASVLGEPESSGFLALSQRGSRGWLEFGNEIYHLLLERGVSRWTTASELRAMGAEPELTCASDELNGSKTYPLADDVELGGKGILALGGPTTWLECEIAVETDYQYFEVFDDLQEAMDYMVALFGAASSRYAEQLGVVLTAPYMAFYQSEFDPWQQQDAGGSCLDVLYEFQGAWQYGGAPIQADLYHLVSGAKLGCGVAWIPGLCDDGYGFAVSGNIHGMTPFPVTVSTLMWDFMVFTHETGHNFNAPHTHDYCPTPVDECAPDGYYGACQTQQTCITDGTLMSYCHQCDGGYLNITTYFHAQSVFDMRNYAEYAFCITPWSGVLTMDECVGSAGTLEYGQGVPSTGGVFSLEMDDGQVAGVTAFLPFSFAAAPGWPPCGLSVPGLGELLLDPAMSPVLVLGGAVTWNGTDPIEIFTGVPVDPTLIGTSLFAQGLFADLAGAAPGEPFRLTGGVEILFGS